MGGEEVGSITLGQYLRQLARHRNFLWFVGMDLVQVREQSPHPGWLGYGNTFLQNWEISSGPCVTRRVIGKQDTGWIGKALDSRTT